MATVREASEKQTRFPPHPMFVHFPIALFFTAVALDIASYWFGNAMVRAAFYDLVIGLVMVVPTALAGLLDFTKLHHGTEAKRTAGVHALVNVIAVLLFFVNAFVRKEELGAQSTSPVLVGMGVVGLAIIAAGGWLGHRIVFMHGANVMSPKRDTTDWRTPMRPQVPVRP